MTNAKTYNATQTEVKDETDQNGQTYNANKVTAHGLKEGTTYYYTYQKDENQQILSLIASFMWGIPRSVLQMN